MDQNALKPCILKIKCNDNYGSGVIFRANKEDKTAYLITAKHIIFGEDYKSFNYPHKEISKENTKVTREIDYKKAETIEIMENKFYFPDDPNVDLSFAVVDKTSILETESVPVVEFFDCESGKKTTINYFLLGYPCVHQNHSENSEMGIYNLLWHIEDNQEYKDKFHLKEKVLSLRSFISDVKGLSGSGIYILSKRGISLSHIQSSAVPPNSVYGVRVDLFIDEINNKLKNISTSLPIIGINESVVSEERNLFFEEITNLDQPFQGEKIATTYPPFLC